MKNIQETINTKINRMAKRNIQKLCLDFDLNMKAVPYSKVVQLESQIIKSDLKKKGADILIIFIFVLMFSTLS